MAESPLEKLDLTRISKQSRQFLEDLRSKIKGQDRALRYIVKAKERFNSPLRDFERPACVFLFLGPSGVGKTATARALAECLFDDRYGFTYVHSEKTLDSQWDLDRHHHEQLERIHRDKLDDIHERGGAVTEEVLKLGAVKERLEELKKEIEELTNKKQPAKIINSKKKEFAALKKEFLKRMAGAHKEAAKVEKEWEYYEELGWIYNKDNPSRRLCSIALFDEVEKADNDFMNYMMDVMNHGYVMSPDYSNSISFRGSFVFLTSNIGSEEIAKELGEILGFKKGPPLDEAAADERLYQVATAAAKEFFPPEFLGRIDKIVVFRPLSPKALREILEILLMDLYNRLSEQNFPLVIRIDQQVKDYIVEKAIKYPELGARLLKNRLKSMIEDRIVSLIETSQISSGDALAVRLKEGVRESQEKELEFYKEKKEKTQE